MKVHVSIDVTPDGEETASWSREIECAQYALDSVLFDFNPTGDPSVTVIKAISAALITKMHRIVHDETKNPQQRRNAALAISEMEAVQMRAVKALFAK